MSFDDTAARAPIKVVVADDSYIIREFLIEALRTSPEVELVAVCRTRTELQTAISRWHPDVVLTDIRMPPADADDGIRIAGELRESEPEMGVVVLSQYAEPAYALALL